MHNHGHSCCCEHKIKLCKVCDVVYCEKCGKEWKYNTSYWFPYTKVSPWTITYGSDASDNLVVEGHKHG